MSRFSDALMDHFQTPRNAGRIDNPDVEAKVGSADNPPFMVLQLRMDGDRIAEARFQTYGCGVAIACGSATTELIVGRTISECSDLRAEEIVSKLDGLPDDRAWCADLAVNAVRDAVQRWTDATL